MELLGILTEIDMAAFAGYCQQVPQVSITQTYLKIMNRFCEQFGLTLSSRSRIVADAGGRRLTCCRGRRRSSGMCWGR